MSGLNGAGPKHLGRREGRRSLAAYQSHARGSWSAVAVGLHQRTVRRGRRPYHLDGASAFSGGSALALVYPLLRMGRSVLGFPTKGDLQRDREGAGCMKRKPTIRSLETVSLEEALAYLDYANEDELDAAYALALDRNRLDGSPFAPDEAEVHHAYFLLSRARGLHPPSFDEMRVELRRRAAA